MSGCRRVHPAGHKSLTAPQLRTRDRAGEQAAPICRVRARKVSWRGHQESPNSWPGQFQLLGRMTYAHQPDYIKVGSLSLQNLRLEGDTEMPCRTAAFHSNCWPFIRGSLALPPPGQMPGKLSGMSLKEPSWSEEGMCTYGKRGYWEHSNTSYMTPFC